MDRLVREPGGVLIATSRPKAALFRNLPFTRGLSDSLEQWFAFLESVKGLRLRAWGESTSRGISDQRLRIQIPLHAIDSSRMSEAQSLLERELDVGVDDGGDCLIQTGFCNAPLIDEGEFDQDR